MTARTKPHPAASPAPQAGGRTHQNRRTFALLLIGLGAVLAGHAAQAQFTDFNDTNQWTLTITGSGGSVQPSADGSAIQFTWATNASSSAQICYQSVFQLSGDWTVQFNYSLDTWPDDNGVLLSAGILPFVAISRQSGDYYIPGENYTFVNGPASVTPTTDMSGMLQYSLQGDTLTGSYWNAASNAWVVLGQAQGFAGPDGPWRSKGPFNLYINNVYEPGGSGQVVVDTISDVLISPASAMCPPQAAVATATVDTNGTVIAVTVTDSGCGYTNAPAVLLQGGGGSGATATAVVSNGVVTGITVTAAGSGYTSAPTVYVNSSLPVAVRLKKAVKPSFANLNPPFNYQLQISTNFTTWMNEGQPFTATNSTMDYPMYFDLDQWSHLLFRLQVVQ
jgi:hypothetical protein